MGVSNKRHTFTTNSIIFFIIFKAITCEPEIQLSNSGSPCNVFEHTKTISLCSVDVEIAELSVLFKKKKFCFYN